MKTHWKKLDNPNYLGAYSLMDGETKELTVTIEKVVNEEIKTDRGSEMCKVAYLKGHKPLILNTTNSKQIEKIYDSPYIEDWAGKKITIYVAKIKAFGETLDALRIKNIKPKESNPELLPNDKKNWDKVVKALTNGYKIDDILTKWSISEQNRELLLSESI